MKLDTSSGPQNISKSHDLTRPCLIFKKAGHTFADCVILNNHAFLKTSFIKIGLYVSAVQRSQADVAVKALCIQLDMLEPDKAAYTEI